MFGIGLSELLLLLVIALFVLRPDQLPEVARMLAHGVRAIRRTGESIRASLELEQETDQPPPHERRAPEDPQK